MVLKRWFLLGFRAAQLPSNTHLCIAFIDDALELCAQKSDSLNKGRLILNSSVKLGTISFNGGFLLSVLQMEMRSQGDQTYVRMYTG